MRIYPDKYNEYYFFFRKMISALVTNHCILHSFFFQTETDVIFKIDWTKIPFLLTHILITYGRHLYPELNHPKIFLLSIIICGIIGYL